MAPAPRPLAVLLALALAVPAAAVPRLALAPVRGDVGGRIGAQLGGALCPPGRCIPGALGGPRPDLSRARRLGAEGSLLGSVWRERGGRVLSLALFGTAAQPARTWVVPLGADGRISAERLGALALELGEAIGDPPLPAPATPPLPRGAPPASRWPPAVSSGPAPVTSPIAVEPGVESARRILRFPAVGTAPVGYQILVPAAPRLALEFRPLRIAGDRGSGPALFLQGSWLPGIALTSGARTHQATFLSLRAGLLWRLAVARRLILAPSVAWARESFVVAPADGTKVPGLPDDRRSGVSVALDAEVPLVGPPGRPRLSALASGRVAGWIDAGELAGGEAFFPGGRAWTVEGEVGASLRLARALTVRLVATRGTTRWALDADPTGAYTVDSARAESLGARLSVRFEP